MSNDNLATKSFIPWKKNFVPNSREYLKRRIKETQILVLAFLYANLTVLLHIPFHIKIIPWKLCILNLKDSLVIYSWSLFFSEKVGRFFEHLLLFPYISKQKINGFKMRNSTNIDEVIKTVLNFLIFFRRKSYTHKKRKNTKSTKRTKNTKAKKAQNANKRISHFLPLRCFLWA